RDAADVEGRRQLHEIGSDELDAIEKAQHLLRLEGREAADLGRARSGRLRGIDSVDVEGQIGRKRPDDGARLIHHRFHAALLKLLDEDEPHAVRTREFDVLSVIGRASDADLYDALGIKQPLLDGAAEWRAMRVFEPTEIAVVEIRMAVEMNHADRPF